jgi:hypothetical protein
MLMDAWARAALENNHVTWADFVGLDTIANSLLMREGPSEDELDLARTDRTFRDGATRAPREGDRR